MSTGSSPQGVVTLSDSEVRAVYQKLDGLQTQISGLSTSLAEIKILVDHGDEANDKIAQVLTDLEKLLYGKGLPDRMGLITRIDHLEKAEARRQKVIGWVWAALAALGIEWFIRFFGPKF